MPWDPPHFGGCAGPLSGTLCQPSLTPWFPLPQLSQPAFPARSWLHRINPLQRHILVSLLLLSLQCISHVVFPGLTMAQTNTLSSALQPFLQNIGVISYLAKKPSTKGLLTLGSLPYHI